MYECSPPKKPQEGALAQAHEAHEAKEAEFWDFVDQENRLIRRLARTRPMS